RAMSIPELVSKVGYFIYEGSDGKERAVYNPHHPQGAMWLYNNLMQTNQGCESVGAAGLSQQSQQIAMMACQHAGQAAFLRNFLAYTGLGIGIAGGVITFGGIIVGSGGLIAAGSALGTGAAGINSVGHTMDGNYGAAVSQAILAPLSTSGYQLIRSARNLTPAERLVLNNIIFKSENIGHLGVTIITTDRR
ncbi:MAG: hypothetical protein JJU35_14490, partial [Balneolales bacterium]|nr:hypothetical protein [Balneolales bacterium]